MASEFIAGLGIFKSLLDSVKGLKDINDAAVITRPEIGPVATGSRLR